MKIYYKNNFGEMLDLMKWPYKIKDSEIFGYEWSYTDTKYVGKNGGKITDFNKKTKKTKAAIDIFAMSKREYQEAVDRFLEVTEKDIMAEIPGRLYVDENYYLCYVYASNKKEWEKMTTYLENNIKIVSPYPLWCRDVTKQFLKGNKVAADTENVEEYLYYPYGYPYRYSMPNDIGFIENDHYAPCDFEMIIYGPCTNPSVFINGHLYEVYTTIYTGEYLKINSRDGTVTRHLNDGRTENKFNSRNKESNLFEKIPAGRCSVLWNVESFGFDITLFQERGEPKWIL